MPFYRCIKRIYQFPLAAHILKGSFNKPSFSVRHNANITGKALQNRAILHRTHQCFLPIVRVLIPNIKVEFVSVAEVKCFSVINCKTYLLRPDDLECAVIWLSRQR